MANPEASRLIAAYPQVFVTDIRRSAAFWREQLGFVVDYLHGDPPFYGLVTRDGAGLNLRQLDALPVDPQLRDHESLLAANIPTTGVEALYREYEARAVPMAQPLQRQPWGTTDFIVRDPDGNLICFASAA